MLRARAAGPPRRAPPVRTALFRRRHGAAATSTSTADLGWRRRSRHDPSSSIGLTRLSPARPKLIAWIDCVGRAPDRAGDTAAERYARRRRPGPVAVAQGRQCVCRGRQLWRHPRRRRRLLRRRHPAAFPPEAADRRQAAVPAGLGGVAGQRRLHLPRLQPPPAPHGPEGDAAAACCISSGGGSCGTGGCTSGCVCINHSLDDEILPLAYRVRRRLPRHVRSPRHRSARRAADACATEPDGRGVMFGYDGLDEVERHQR